MIEVKLALAESVCDSMSEYMKMSMKIPLSYSTIVQGKHVICQNSLFHDALLIGIKRQ